NYSQKLVAFVNGYLADQAIRSGEDAPDALTPAEAWDVFKAMPLEQRELLVGDVFFDILNHVGLDYNNADSRFFAQYGRGYQAIEDLFPSADGYTENALGIKRNGALQRRITGTFDMRGTTVQTQFGGNISIL